MTKQEEIREGIRPFFCECCEPADRGCSEYDGRCSMVDEALPKLWAYLHSQGVVIKVDRELPHKMPQCPNNEWSAGYCCGEEFMQDVMVEANYVAVEPLIEAT